MRQLISKNSLFIRSALTKANCAVQSEKLDWLFEELELYRHLEKRIGEEASRLVDLMYFSLRPGCQCPL